MKINFTELPTAFKQFITFCIMCNQNQLVRVNSYSCIQPVERLLTIILFLSENLSTAATKFLFSIVNFLVIFILPEVLKILLNIFVDNWDWSGLSCHNWLDSVIPNEHELAINRFRACLFYCVQFRRIQRHTDENYQLKTVEKEKSSHLEATTRLITIMPQKHKKFVYLLIYLSLPPCNN